MSEPLPKKILVVDDNYSLASTIQAVLEDDGYEVMSATDGIHGYAAYLLFEPDLIITDIRMPGIDGLQFLRQVQEKWPELPVILSSGYTEQDALSRFQEPGLRGFIQKPYSPKELVVKIQGATGPD